MSLKKTVAIVAAAGALTALALPAMAFDNEFHGSYKLKWFLSNYETGQGGNALNPSAGYVPIGGANQTDNLKMNNFFEQRARLFYTAKASDELKLVTAFEIDSIWGDYSQGGFTRATSATAGVVNTGTVNNGTAFRNSGGALESDAVNLETKWVYLDFKIPSTPTRTTVGIQAVKDSLKGVFFDADVAGILTSTKVGAATVNVGYFRGYDQSFFSTSRPRGMDNLNIGAVEGKFALSKDANMGAVYYVYGDTRGATNAATAPLGVTYNAALLHVLGLTADAKVGALDLSGFLAYQGGVFRAVGNTSNSVYHNALAYNMAAKLAAGPGSLRTALLFTSGQGALDRNHTTGWYGVQYSPNIENSGFSAAGPAANTYNESNMMLLNRAAQMGGTTADMSLVYETGNGTNPLTSQGVYLYTLGYDGKFTPKFYTNANLGMAWVARTNSLKPRDKATGQQNGTNFMGTEINVETGYKMYDNLTASLQAAYVILGGYYNGSSAYGTTASPKDPENPYTVRTVLTYAF